ncbi:hypothetical protein QMK19_14705 [Streptomyces sp. H10-C2]|uniref:hypothetical protein n=1 Tax=unclassified Streptomyces TaxID=2593676 RepID=UPI0024BB4032|nr:MULTISPECIES: hypothetical protein [unclassified Streptomyces]MDJ0341306.1 hypothetical protein [Streptomyces sp. PH10-H1]MDJ0370901.1 hypothetical protein [Streptomyces sp. H10-C2]
MSALFSILLVVAVIAVALGSAALHSARGLRRELVALREDLAFAGTAASTAAGTAVPAARPVPADEIRAAVADALADERERELAEARAFWAEQEARESADGPFFRGGIPAPGTDYAEYEIPTVLPFLPRQADLAGLEAEPALPMPGALPHPAGQDFADYPDFPDLHAGHSASVVASQKQTAERLTDLADGRIPLSDVRPGPLGTLDVYVFADGTTLCMTPGHRETALQLSEALERGEVPVLLGGSAVGGAHALTFTYGDESVYILADRVVASL